jgi:hypothetical protein
MGISQPRHQSPPIAFEKPDTRVLGQLVLVWDITNGFDTFA